MTIRRLNDPFITFSAHITIGRFSKSESMDPLAEELLLIINHRVTICNSRKKSIEDEWKVGLRRDIVGF